MELAVALKRHYKRDVIDQNDVEKFIAENGIDAKKAWKSLSSYRKQKTVDLTDIEGSMIEEYAEQMYVPEKEDLYVVTTYHNEIKNIIESKIFFPTMITGPSGVGKTMTVRQVCAELGREMIRVNITIETDEDSLMGGFRLVNGSTAFHKGPVITAMERGAVLVLDEYDLGSPTRMMCLQSIMENQGYLIKRTGELVKPAPGFMIFATANTKGAGDVDGRYIGTQIFNEAALDRFPCTITADYPSREHEKGVLERAFSAYNVDDAGKIELLLNWVEQVRKLGEKNANLRDLSISTRRLVDISKAAKIFGGDLRAAIEACINRYTEDQVVSLMKVYDSLIPTTDTPEAKPKRRTKLDETLESLEAW